MCTADLPNVATFAANWRQMARRPAEGRHFCGELATNGALPCRMSPLLRRTGDKWHAALPKVAKPDRLLRICAAALLPLPKPLHNSFTIRQSDHARRSGELCRKRAFSQDVVPHQEPAHCQWCRSAPISTQICLKVFSGVAKWGRWSKVCIAHRFGGGLARLPERRGTG